MKIIIQCYTNCMYINTITLELFHKYDKDMNLYVGM